MTPTVTFRLSLCAAVALSACTDRAQPGAPDAATPAIDASHDAGERPAADAATPDAADAGDECPLDCPELPVECYYESPDCAAGTCGQIVCPGPHTMCGSLFHGRCRSDEYCDYFIEGACGSLDEVGLCRPRPGECAGAPVERVCACDGTTYESACEAHRAGFEVVMPGECPPPDLCRGDDAFGTPDCRDELGWKWDGNRCAPVVGCACEGTFCEHLFADQAACRAGSTTCIASRCRPLDARAVTTGCDEPSSLGWTWDGAACVALVGCTCEGAQCWIAEGSAEADCEAEHVDCASLEP